MPPNDYIAGRGLTEQELHVASFWVKHHLLLHKLGFGALIALNLGFWAFALWGLLDAYAISYPRESRIITYISQNQLLTAGLQATTPQPIQSTNALNFTSTEGRKDFLVQATNPNPQWWAEFDYYFNLGDATTTQKTGFLLPNSQQYLTELGYPTSSTGIGVQAVLENIRWHRIQPDQVEGNYTQFQDKRLQIKTTDIAYHNEALIGTKTMGQTTFTVTNDSAFGYWDVKLTIVLMRAGSPIAVNTVDVQSLKPGEVRPITLNWGELITGVTDTEITPSINILDPSVYLPSTQF